MAFSKNTKPNNAKQKPRMNTTSYEKAFESFNEMIDCFKGLHPEFSEIFRYEDDVVTPKNAASDVIEYFQKNTPNIVERVNLLSSINISANRVSLKTNKFFMVEWAFKYDREANITDLVATVTTYTREQNSEELENMISKLEVMWNHKEEKPRFNRNK